tara:strand:- start:1226 stop:1405 length:180 start_codon:yes stop_codon:yes gene_type:complete
MSKVSIQKNNNYCIVSAYGEDIKEMISAISNLIEEGWALAGGVASSNSKIFQALYLSNE